ncbi:MAG: aldose epimerase family protein [Bacteroidota bacterium]
MKITRKGFGHISEEEIYQYILENDIGMLVKVINYGATITSIKIPKSKGTHVDVVCGFDKLEGYFSSAYIQNAPYFGCTVGRYSSRIKDGTFQLDGQTYELAVNDGSNHLHGGLSAFDKKIWKAEEIENPQEVGVKMSLKSPHMEEGYPGNVEVSVIFSLNNQNELNIKYAGKTDQATPLSLTNHSYFNLSGFRQTIEDHTATIYSDTHLVADETNVPLGNLASIKGSPLDLRSGTVLKDAFKELATGFENYYVFDLLENGLAKVAEFEDAASKRKLEVYTSEPGMLFYTGYFTSEELQRENGDKYGRYRGFCCETHRYPNGPNIPHSPNSITRVDNPYSSQTKFKFTWE